VIGLRVLDTDQSYEFDPGMHIQVIGSSAACNVVIRRHRGSVAAQHARLVRRRSQWMLHAIADPYDDGGVCRDRVALREFPLLPGLEFRIGTVSLVAESQRSRALRRILARLVGLGPERRADVDRALRTVVMAASGRRPLLLCGDGDLVYVARQVHRHTLADRPFILCDPRRRGRGRTAKSPWKVDNPMAALAAAAGGTLCVPNDRLPLGFEGMIEHWRRSETRVQLVLFTRAVDPALTAVTDALVLAPMFLRWRDRFRIIDEVAADAALAFGIPVRLVSDADRRVILASDAATLPALETATVRIVALRHWADDWGGLTRCASELGMARAALAEWAERRGLIEIRHRTGGVRRGARIER
jgi:hypothetical protein